MLKKVIVALLVVGLVASPAVAGKKKKKGPKPYTSEEANVLVPHTHLYGSSGTFLGVTAQEFIANCGEIPRSNGFDGYIMEVPAEYQKIVHSVEAVGSSSGPLSYDLDMALFNENCEITVAYQGVGTDEIGTAPAGTAWVFTHNYQGDPNVSFHLELAPAKTSF